MDTSGSPRLPTRCPLCKGAVIERLSTSSHGSYIWFHCLFCNHHWKFHRADDITANPSTELIGDVAVISRGGKKHKLDAVVVSVIPEDALRKHLKSKMLQGEADREKLERDIESLTAALAKAQSEDDRLWKILKRDESDTQKASAWSAAYNKAKNIAKQIEELRAERQRLASGDYFFDGLPSPIAEGKTNAHGKFSIIIPRRGRYGVVARATRELFKKTETYYWFVWVTLDGEPSKRVSLSSENIMGAGSTDSALR
jgi:hypothetical protein